MSLANLLTDKKFIKLNVELDSVPNIDDYNKKYKTSIRKSQYDDYVIKNWLFLLKEKGVVKRIKKGYGSNWDNIKRYVILKRKEAEKKNEHIYLIEQIMASSGLRKLEVLKKVFPNDPILNNYPWLITRMRPGYWDNKSNRKKGFEWLMKEVRKDNEFISRDYIKKKGLSAFIGYYNKINHERRFILPFEEFAPNYPFIKKKPWRVIKMRPKDLNDEDNRIKMMKDAIRSLKPGEYLTFKHFESIGLKDFINHPNRNYETTLPFFKCEIKKKVADEYINYNFWNDPNVNAVYDKIEKMKDKKEAAKRLEEFDRLSKKLRQKSRENEERKWEQYIVFLYNSKVKELRKKQSIKREELAKKTGLSKEAIFYIEEGIYKTSVVETLTIAKQLNTTVEELFILK
jgi:putative transcriptional regulator